MKMHRAAILVAIMVALIPALCLAGGDPPAGKDPFGTFTNVKVTVTSTPSGVYIQISVQQSAPGSKSPSSPTKPTPVPATPSGSSPSSGAPAPTPTGVRVWSDDSGIYEQTSDGHLYYLTIPNISSQSDWPSELQSHPNQTPYVLYIDNQFQKIIWIPNGPSSGSVNFGAPPTVQPNPAAPPVGNGSGTDPYQIALNLLDHVPLPNVQINENPALGLVNLPGWFWINGYDGKPFGDSQTVTIPPAVGPSVPFTQVPATDPSRQPTYFTVSVQVWPTGYQWSFGDGASLVTQSLGQSYPAQSDIQHVYQTSSLRTQNGFPVQVTVVFAAQYQVNGGGAQALPSMSHAYAATYPVQEAQSLLKSR